MFGEDLFYLAQKLIYFPDFLEFDCSFSLSLKGHINRELDLIIRMKGKNKYFIR